MKMFYWISSLTVLATSSRWMFTISEKYDQDTFSLHFSSKIGRLVWTEISLIRAVNEPAGQPVSYSFSQPDMRSINDQDVIARGISYIFSPLMLRCILLLFTIIIRLSEENLSIKMAFIPLLMILFRLIINRLVVDWISYVRSLQESSRTLCWWEGTTQSC